VATRPIEDLDAYQTRLSNVVFRTGLTMKPVFDRAKADPKQVAFADGEEEVILRAAQVIIDEGLARPILIGRPDVIAQRIERAGLRLQAERDFELCNIHSDPRFDDYWQHYHRLMERHGVTPAHAKAMVRSRGIVIAALMVERGDADAMIGGLVGQYHRKLRHVTDIIGLDTNVEQASAMSAVATDKGVFFFLDTYVQENPNAEQIAEATLMAAMRLKIFGIQPHIALLSHSNFGSRQTEASRKMQQALKLIRARTPRMEVEGEMQADVALNPEIRSRLFPNSLLSGEANMFVFPNLDAANIAYNMTRHMSDGVTIGPILMGVAKPVHLLTPQATVRRVVNLTALASVEAQVRAGMAREEG
jgi:malate dehydrogenase (oxaloacetate-decarboxylating)(NADP+)